MPTEHINFWKGFVLGTLAGIAVAIFSNLDMAIGTEVDLEMAPDRRPVAENTRPAPLSNTA